MVRRDLAVVLLLVAATLAAGIAHAVAEPSFFWQEDYQSTLLPGLVEVSRAWFGGSAPLLSRSSWFLGNLAGEFQYNALAAPGVLCTGILWSLGLSPTATATGLSLIFVCIAAVGAYYLARSYGLRPSLAAMVAIVASQNGWIIQWGARNWILALLSFAWLPWVWLGYRSIALKGPSFRRIVLTGVALYCLITAGWPFSILAAALLFAVYCLSVLRTKELRKAAALTAAGILGVALSAPALFLLIDYLGQTARDDAPLKLWFRWTVPAPALLGAILPTFTSNWFAWFGATSHSAIELAGALVPSIGLIAALRLRGREFLKKHVQELALLVVITVLMMWPSVGPFRFSFRWLPPWHLVLALLGALGIEELWRARESGERRTNVGLWGIAIVGIALLLALAGDDSPQRTLKLGALLLAATAVWAYAERSDIRRLSMWLPVAIAWLSVWSVHSIAAPESIVRPPVWRFADLREPEPFDRTVLYFDAYMPAHLYGFDRRLETAREANPLFRPGNTAMFADLRFVNGYSPMEASLIRDTLHLGYLGFAQDGWSCLRLAHFETRPGALFAHMGVGGLVMREEVRALGGPNALDGWRLAASSADQRMFHRVALDREPVVFAGETLALRSEAEAIDWIWRRTEPAMPFLVIDGNRPGSRATMCRARVVSSSDSRLKVTAAVDTTGCAEDALLVFRRPNFHGYRADLDGAPLPVVTADVIMPAVRIPPGRRGVVTLRYLPTAFLAGLAVAGAAILIVIVCGAALIRSKPR